MLVINENKTYTVFQRFHLLTLFISTLALNILNIYCPAQKKTNNSGERTRSFSGATLGYTADHFK